MLPIPESDWSEPGVLEGWVELSVLAGGPGFATRGAILEALRDSTLFTTSRKGDGSGDTSDGTATSTVGAIWKVLDERSALLGNAWPFALTNDRVELLPGKTIKSAAAYITMLLLEAASCGWYKSIAIPKSHVIRSLFETIAGVSIARLGGGRVERFGAPYPKDWPKTFPSRVERLAGTFGLAHQPDAIARIASLAAQDATLDLVARWSIVDQEPGGLYLLVQCATGANWRSSKSGEPSVELWKKFVSWNGKTTKALAVPFAMRGRELEQACFYHNEAVIFDRLRLAAGRPDEGIDSTLRGKLETWCKEKLGALGPATPPSLPTKRTRRSKR